MLMKMKQVACKIINKIEAFGFYDLKTKVIKLTNLWKGKLSHCYLKSELEAGEVISLHSSVIISLFIYFLTTAQ